MTTLRGRSLRDLLPAGIVVGLLLGVAWLARGGIGMMPLLAAGAGVGALTLLARPGLAPFVLVIAAIMVRPEFGGGGYVALNAATLLAPALAGVWFVRGVIARDLRRLPTPADAPWVWFLLALLLSLVVGRATWDPGVPQPGNLLMVQLGQYAIFAIAAIAYWLPGLTLRKVADLERLTWFLLYVVGALGLARLVPGGERLVAPFTTIVFIRAPFWVLIVSLAGGLLLFHPGLTTRRRVFLVALIFLSIFESTFRERLSISEWAGVWIVLAILGSLRFPRLRWVALLVIIVLLAAGQVAPALWEFAGGEQRWIESGASRLVLISRVVGVTMRNPITGLGPASYRFYAGLEPLRFGRALWFHPQINSHNNWVDIFSFGGLLGLGLFGWLAWRIYQFGIGLTRATPDGFARAYANCMVALWGGLLAIMLLADWVFPFVYNIGFPGFQASILGWLFVGGLAVLPRRSEPGQ